MTYNLPPGQDPFKIPGNTPDDLYEDDVWVGMCQVLSTAEMDAYFDDVPGWAIEWIDWGISKGCNPRSLGKEIAERWRAEQ